MRRLFAWAAGLVSIAALARLLGRRRRPAPVETVSADPADELRRKLADTRTPDSPETPTSTDDPTAEREPLEAKRARVHAKAQEALDAMRGDEQ